MTSFSHFHLRSFQRMTCLFLVIFVLPALAAAEFTDFDKPFTLKCVEGNVVNRLVSRHHNKFEDRKWIMDCGANPATDTISGCQWTDYVNDFDAKFDFTCPNNSVISGISSIHQNKEEDRRYKFLCCGFSNYAAANCVLGNYVNDYDQPMDFSISSTQVIAGVASKHDDNSEDRKFRFRVCDFKKLDDPGVGK